MITLAILAILLCAATVGLAAWGAVLPRATANARVREIETYGYPTDEPAAREAKPSRAFGLITNVGAFVAEHVGAGYERRIKASLVTAGMYDVAPRTVAGVQVLMAALCGGAVALVGIGSTTPVRIAAVAGFAAFGWGIPWILIVNKALRRRDQIERKVPDMIDMLVVTLEAGLGFAASMQAASQRIAGPLGQELKLTMQEQDMGLTLADALLHTAQRTRSRSMESFVRAVTQGEALGVSIGTVMRDIAEEMRVRRRQEAEERAQKAPVKMLFPLIFLMFPALMVVILGPALFEIFDVLGGM